MSVADFTETVGLADGPSNTLSINPDAGKPRVNRDDGIITGVKVCGIESANGRVYTADVLRRAVPLYENAPVYIDHQMTAGVRGASDKFGELRFVHVKNDGLYANLHYLVNHPMAGRVAEAAEKMPNTYGLSHNVKGATETRDGKVYVTEILKVVSVDLVSSPASTRGLFEHREMSTPHVPTTTAEYVEALTGRRQRSAPVTDSEALTEALTEAQYWNAKLRGEKTPLEAAVHAVDTKLFVDQLLHRR